MTYYIQQLLNTSNGVNYWTDILDSNGIVYSTTDLVVLEAKLIELMLNIPRSKLQPITKLTVTDDLTVTQ